MFPKVALQSERKYTPIRASAEDDAEYTLNFDISLSVSFTTNINI